jgi:hypothetical protein
MRDLSFRRQGALSRRRSVMVILPVVGLLAAGAAPDSGPAFRILSQTELPAELQRAVDVRWASDQSLYFALQGHGVVEAPVVAGRGAVKEMIPGKDQPGGLWNAYRVAASGDYLVATAPLFEVAWRSARPGDDPGLVEAPFEYVQAIDVQARKLAIVGVRSDEKRNFAPDGAIGWTGSLGKRLSDLKPILFSATGRGATGMLNCGALGLAAVRFLTDGEVVMIPGVQPGVEWFDGGGKPVRGWDTATLGIDTDCSSLTPQLVAKLAANYPLRLDWINLRRTVDSILPLPQGAGVLVRTASKSATHWELKILHRDGTWTTSQVPLQGESPFAHLRGDVRAGRLVLLLYEDRVSSRPKAQGRLITAQLGG